MFTFPTSLQSLEILIYTEDVEILGPRFGRIQESDEPCVILTLQNGEVIRIEASDKQYGTKLQIHPTMQNEIREVYEAVHQAY